MLHYLTVVATNITRIRDQSSAIGERADLGPGDTSIGTLPKAIAASRPEVEDVRVLRVDGQSLASASTGHIASDLEGEIRRGPCVSSILGPDDGSRVGVP